MCTQTLQVLCPALALAILGIQTKPAIRRVTGQREAGMKTTTNQQHDSNADDQEEPEVWTDGWDLVHHSGYPRLDGPGTEAPWGCVQ